MSLRWQLWLESVLAPSRIVDRHKRLSLERPVILMGRGKSGTRLLAWACTALGVAIGATPRRPSGDIEHRYFRQTVRTLARRNLTARTHTDFPPWDVAWFQHAVDHAWSMLRRIQPDAILWGWKWPETYLIAPLVLRTFPRARFIHIVRDGRDVAFKHHLTDDLSRPLGQALLRHLGAQTEPHYLQAARSWQYQVEVYRQFSALLAPDQHLDLTYEDLCRAPQEMLEQVAAFLGLPMTTAVRDYAGEIRQDNIKQFYQAPESQLREVEALIGSTLSALGYSLVTSSPIRPPLRAAT
ncbi:MAG: sulfotransferase [Deltaproteobacteria bacterium]|nr:sulfotransferase [Deltaproteobacteria bacterium]